MFDWSVRLALKYEVDGANGFFYELQRKIADKLIYSKWRAAIGGKLVCMASGGAALNPKLERIFLCADIIVLQGYGLTETCVVVSVNHFGKGNIRIGCVGPVIEKVEVKIAEEDGEILVKGPSIMMGYYKNKEATDEVMDADGWFHTGDVGKFEGRFLKITDRKKEIFKTSGGKYIAPQMIENKLKESQFIEQVMVIGENQKFPSSDFRKCDALLTLILPFSVSVGHFRDRAGLKEEHLRDPFEGVDARWQRRRIGDFDGEVPFPARLKRSNVDDDPATGVARFAKTDP